MALDWLGDEDAITWRRALIIGIIFITLVIAAGVALVVFRPFFESILLSL